MKAEYEMNHRINKLSVLAMALVLAGCTMAPDYERPSAPTSSSYPSGAAYAQGTVSAAQTAVADIGWRDFYRDPLLQQLLEVALANNRDLRKSVLDVEAARAQYRIRRADMLPTLNVDAGATVQRLPANVSPSGTTQITRSYDVNGAVSAWELDLWGRVRSLSDRALATYLALDETRIAARLSLLAEVTNAYLTLRADQELLQLAHDTLSTQKRTYALTQALFDAGNATQIDLRRAEIALRTAEVSQAAYTRVAAQDRNALVLLLGQPLTAELSASLDKANTLPDDIIPSALPAGLPAELLVRRPDVRAAEQQLRAANANIGAARAAFFPAISLTGSAGTASSSLDGLFEPGSAAWSFVPQISLPIFRGGALRANLDLAQVQKRIEIANYEKAIQVAFREVADGLAGRQTLDDQFRSEQLLVQASQANYELASQRFRAGIDDNLAELDAQRALFSAQQTLVQTRLARMSNLVNLYKALGGGWTESSPAKP